MKARQAGLVAETIKAIDVMMGRGKKLAAAAELKLALAIYKQARVSYALEDTRQLAIVLGLEARAEDEDMDEFDAKVDKAAAVYLKGHEVGAFAALGLLHGACLIEQTNDSCSIGECAEMLVGSKAFAKKDFPLLQEEWESQQKRREDLAAKMQPSVEPEEEEEQEDAA